eukprot:8584685-Pyramimonas_sp.AAC.2
MEEREGWRRYLASLDPDPHPSGPESRGGTGSGLFQPPSTVQEGSHETSAGCLVRSAWVLVHLCPKSWHGGIEAEAWRCGETGARP